MYFFYCLRNFLLKRFFRWLFAFFSKKNCFGISWMNELKKFEWKYWLLFLMSRDSVPLQKKDAEHLRWCHINGISISTKESLAKISEKNQKQISCFQDFWKLPTEFYWFWTFLKICCNYLKRNKNISKYEEFSENLINTIRWNR